MLLLAAMAYMNLRLDFQWGILGAALALSALFFAATRALRMRKGEKVLCLILPLLLLFLGIVVRIYCIERLTFEPVSDFRLYYETAKSLADGARIQRATFISYNSYVYVFSWILAQIFKVTGASVKVVLYFNLFCQLMTLVVMRAFVRRFGDETLGNILPALWFLLPPVFFAGLLVSTETLFILLLLLSLTILLDLVQWEKQRKSVVLASGGAFGALLALTNHTRPVVAVLLVAMAIGAILIEQRRKQYLALVLITGISFVLVGAAMDAGIERSLGQPLRKGAMEWSMYYGANEKTDGYWSEEDGAEVSALLEKEGAAEILMDKTKARYRALGISGTVALTVRKYECLWTDVNSMYTFVNTAGIRYPALTEKYEFINFVTRSLFLAMLLLGITSLLRDIVKKGDRMNLLQLFTLGYIFAAAIVCVNGRYNYPIFTLLCLIIANRSGESGDSKSISGGR